MARGLLLVAASAAMVAAAFAGSVEPTFVVSSGSLVAAKTIGWEVAGSAAADHPIRATISLRRTNDEALTNLAMDVSHPDSPNYTKYPTMEELTKMTAPSSESVAAVTEWLAAAGVNAEWEASGAAVVVSVTAEKAATLFGTKFHTVKNSITGQVVVVGEEARVPQSVSEHVETVFGIHNLPLPPRQGSSASAGRRLQGSPADVTPKVITKAYNVSGVKPAGTTANRQAVAEFQGQLLSQTDLSTFFSKYLPDAPSGSDKVFKYVGDSQQGEGVEANLDIQYIMGVAPGIKTEAWQYAGQGFCADLKQFTQQIISTQNPPNVFSVSYGWQGDMSQIGCSTSQISSIDADFKTITATGVSIIFASGDSGSGYSSFFGSNPKLYASWPASSVWVTAVGATRFINQQPGDGEQATDQFGSGGGFSRIVTPAPAWQSSAISTFYSEETKAPTNTTYGFGGRGTPDVAALGEGFQVIMNGSPESVGGTSAAAPTFSALVSLANDARIQAGKKPLGNLNQWIYKEGNSIFLDVTVGSDRISRQGSSVPLGFDCEKGWDPVTGFGTVLFKKFLKSAMSN